MWFFYVYDDCSFSKGLLCLVIRTSYSWGKILKTMLNVQFFCLVTHEMYIKNGRHQSCENAIIPLSLMPMNEIYIAFITHPWPRVLLVFFFFRILVTAFATVCFVNYRSLYNSSYPKPSHARPWEKPRWRDLDFAYF